jgi:hypothetical protein
MPDVHVHRYQAWDYSSPRGATFRWFYRVNGGAPSSKFDWQCVRVAERFWRRRRIRAGRRAEQLELFARSSNDDTVKLMMPSDAQPNAIATS